jgi:hypothetical protein
MEAPAEEIMTIPMAVLSGITMTLMVLPIPLLVHMAPPTLIHMAHPTVGMMTTPTDLVTSPLEHMGRATRILMVALARMTPTHLDHPTQTHMAAAARTMMIRSDHPTLAQAMAAAARTMMIPTAARDAMMTTPTDQPPPLLVPTDLVTPIHTAHPTVEAMMMTTPMATITPQRREIALSASSSRSSLEATKSTDINTTF